MKTINFQINNHETRNLEIICSCIDISNIEKYLKRVGEVENKEKVKISFVPNKYIYSLPHLLFAMYITEAKFIDNLNVSNNFSTEMLLTLSCSDQIKKIHPEIYLKEGNNKNIFVLVLSEKIISNKILETIKKELNIKEEKENKVIKFNIKDTLDYYKIKEPNAEDKIIEKMALSAIDK